jgi:hypothetical protein
VKAARRNAPLKRLSAADAVVAMLRQNASSLQFVHYLTSADALKQSAMHLDFSPMRFKKHAPN